MGRVGLLARANAEHPPTSPVHRALGGSSVSQRPREAAAPATQTHNAQPPPHFCADEALLTRPPTQEPHSVPLAGVAPVIAHKPIILASLVDNLGAEVCSIHCRGLRTAWEL